jgi:hypothetical protein
MTGRRWRTEAHGRLNLAPFFDYGLTIPLFLRFRAFVCCYLLVFRSPLGGHPLTSCCGSLHLVG